MKISPAVKGLITVIAMIAVFISIFYTGDHADVRFQYFVYIIYAMGISWALISYRRSDAFTGNFGALFNQGFRCFVVVTLVIAIFYGIFNYMHPEFAEESAKGYRESLTANKQTLPPDIDKEVATYKKQYILKLVSGAIFGYLIIGAGVTAILSALLARKK